MEFASDLLLQFFIFLPLVSGAYITILVLRFPDLTIEASWSIGAILACFAVFYLHVPPLIAVFLGGVAGALSGCLTSFVFVVSGRAKLLAGLISLYILEATGFHLLGDSASIHLGHDSYRFGFPNCTVTSMAIYGLFSVSIFVLVAIWQRTSVGIKSRLIGENPTTSVFYKISLDKYYTVGLVLSNAIIGLGGGLYGMYYAHASNAQGIGLVIKAFLALLIGDELLKLLKFTNRTISAAIIAGTFLFVLLSVGSEAFQLELASKVDRLWFKPTDKQFVVAFVLIAILWFRRGRTKRKGTVSEW